VGRQAGERILAGRILRGDTENIRAIIWFSDLRGFTALTASLPPAAVVRTLNDLFDCQVPAVERRGGEILKFMGDGLLAIFPIDEGRRSLPELCDAALAGADDAFAELAVINQARQSRGEPPIRFGLALHLGDVAYGNIGGSARLDFTCIGAAVNVAARLEGLTEQLDRPIVLSEEFARLTSRPVELLGTLPLKGVAGPQRVWAPVAPAPA
jgi:adenylate cyclase